MDGELAQEAQRLATVEEGKGWGLEGVEALAGGHSSETALQMWIRSSLNERALGSRLRALCNMPSLLQAWYSRWLLSADDLLFGHRKHPFWHRLIADGLR